MAHWSIVLVFGGWPAGVACLCDDCGRCRCVGRGRRKPGGLWLDSWSTGIYGRLATVELPGPCGPGRFARADGAPYSCCPDHGAHGALFTLACAWLACRRDGRRALLEIAGPNSTEGRELPWIGEGSARVTVRDAHRALLLFGYVCVMNAVFILGGAIRQFCGYEKSLIRR